MRVEQFNLDADVTAALGGTEAIADIVATFHAPGDCAACGRPLGERGRFSLYVQDSGGPLVSVRPLHAPCYSTHRRIGSTLRMTDDTYRGLPAVIPTTVEAMPVVFVNAAIDQVVLTRRDNDQPPTDRTVPTLLAAGWYSGPGHGTNTSVGEAALHGEEIRLTGAAGTWVFDTPPGFAETVRLHGLCHVTLLRRTLVDDIFTAPDPLAFIGKVFDSPDAVHGDYALTTPARSRGRA